MNLSRVFRSLAVSLGLAAPDEDAGLDEERPHCWELDDEDPGHPLAEPLFYIMLGYVLDMLVHPLHF
jgi:hypothetical protein